MQSRSQFVRPGQGPECNAMAMESVQSDDWGLTPSRMITQFRWLLAIPCAAEKRTNIAGRGAALEDIVDHDDQVGGIDGTGTIHVGRSATWHGRAAAFEYVIHH